jgi:uncharacterized protein YdeI (YjbR/CyaY-like superfamily)
MNPKVDFYFKKAKSWRAEFAAMRRIALDCELSEELKWGHPCYTLAGRNVVVIHGFKDYCAYLFFKGALLKDPKQLLIQQTGNVQSSRQIRFRNLAEIESREGSLKEYIREAIAVERSGAKVKMKPTAAYAVPQELQARLDKSAKLKQAFSALTPGRQRGYLLHIGRAKLSATRAARVQRCVPKILAGKGLDD